MPYTLRAAERRDLPAVVGLITELAEFERLTHLLQVTPASLEPHLFGPRPAAECVVAEGDDGLVAFALFFQNFSTFLGRPGLYLEDLYVQPAHRGAGLGRQLLEHLGRLAVERGCGRFEWSVLDWNDNAIRFYEKMGATVMPDWRICRVTGEAPQLREEGMRLQMAALLLAAAQSAMAAVDIDALWDYGNPAESEARFRTALRGAKGDDPLILRTQIARTYSLRSRFDEAHHELDIVEPLLPSARSAEPRVRTLLERGRTLRSANQPVQARPLFVRAFEVADQAGLQSLAADALHMVALTEPDLPAQLEWNRRTLDYARSAQDPKARRWEAVALNNLGDALREAGRLDEALATFREALAAYQGRGKPADVRFARWQVANTLRLLGRIDDALGMQLALEAEWRADGHPEPDVYEELALLYDAKGDASAAAQARERQQAAASK